VVIADAGGFSNAARRLHLTQPALSRQIRVLEHELGTRLFARVGRTVEVTEAGIDLLRHARTILADADSLRDRARALVSGDVGVLRVGTTPQTLEAVLAPFVGGYRRRHPGVSVHFTEDGGVALLGYLERGQVQLTVTIAGDDRFRHRALFPALILAVMPATHRLHRRLVVEVTDLTPIRK
jgi:DNA-binding transcriptional LysR family regulator